MKVSGYLYTLVLGTIVALSGGVAPCAAQDDATMNNTRLDGLIRKIDEQAAGGSGVWQLTIEDRPLNVITDEDANRMRIITGVAHASALSREQLYRLMQANFDSALDARYSIAKEIVWSTFIHPLSSLSDEQFVLGLGQVVNLANTYGSSFSSGVLRFGGGDSLEQERKLLDRLKDKGLSI